MNPVAPVTAICISMISLIEGPSALTELPDLEYLTKIGSAGILVARIRQKRTVIGSPLVAVYSSAG